MTILAIGETRDVKSGWGRYAHEVLSQYEKNYIDYDFLSKADLLPYSPLNFSKNVFLVRGRMKTASIVHSFDVWPFAVYAYLANFGFNKPLFISSVGTYSLPPKSGFKGYLMRKAYAKSKKIFCISNYTQKVIQERGAKGYMEVVRWGTSTLSQINKEEIETFSRNFKVNLNQGPIVLTVGQIKHRKGQLDTLKAIKILRNKYPDILYITVGSTADQTYVGSMREYAKENNLDDNFLIANTQKTDRELAFFYNTCDIFAMNSNNEGDHFEGFGLVFLEAAQFGKPAVGSRGCGIEDAIEDGKTGFLTNQGDAADIAEKMDKLFSGNTKKFGEVARSRAKEFTWEKTVDQYITSYKKYVS